jgi:signal transduction histidine kinase
MAFILVVALMAISGMYFVSSIVTPVARICSTTAEIAKGDLSARIDYDYYQDEIGELCMSINNMAQQLSEIDKMKNDFISTVSHEIRTPMTAIKGWGETLKNVGDNPALMEKGLDIIVSETDRLSVMVEELLDFSRMQNGKIRIVNEEIDLLYIVEQVYNVYKQKAINEKINLSLNIGDETELNIIGDRDRIRQVIINILDNAIKYTPENGNITISVARIQKYVKIIISDTGKGIPQKDLPHIKEKFYKADNNVRGTGIGLAVADEIIKMHSGELNISSEPGEGTDVEIILPIISKEK